jgi:hypothetical protein
MQRVRLVDMNGEDFNIATPVASPNGGTSSALIAKDLLNVDDSTTLARRFVSLSVPLFPLGTRVLTQHSYDELTRVLRDGQFEFVYTLRVLLEFESFDSTTQLRLVAACTCLMGYDACVLASRHWGYYCGEGSLHTRFESACAKHPLLLASGCVRQMQSITDSFMRFAHAAPSLGEITLLCDFVGEWTGLLKANVFDKPQGEWTIELLSPFLAYGSIVKDFISSDNIDPMCYHDYTQWAETNENQLLLSFEVASIIAPHWFWAKYKGFIEAIRLQREHGTPTPQSFGQLLIMHGGALVVLVMEAFSMPYHHYTFGALEASLVGFLVDAVQSMHDFVSALVVFQALGLDFLRDYMRGNGRRRFDTFEQHFGSSDPHDDSDSPATNALACALAREPSARH